MLRSFVCLAGAVVVAAVSFAPPSSALDEYEQWGLERVRAPEAWARSRGADVLVAILDTGLHRSHPDLAPNTPTTGHDFVDNDDDAAEIPGQTHGTRVAGIVAAAQNGVGVAGTAPDAKLLPVRVCAAGCPRAAIRAGIIWAVDQGARVVNLSLGGIVPLGTEGEDAAIAYAVARGAVVVAAAGNDASWPYCYHPALNPLVLCVGASDELDARWASSTHGARLDVLAPGTEIVSTVPPAEYGATSGTSFAAPFVSGVAALLLDMGATALQATDIIRRTARDVGPSGYDLETGWGILDAKAAVDRCAEVCSP